jgi:hypothetical protein
MVKELHVETHLHLSASNAFAIRTYASFQHLQSASILERATRQAQDAWGGREPTWDQEGLAAIVANATGTVFCAVAFLEASINELYIDALGHKEEIVRAGRTKLLERRPALLSDLAAAWPRVPKGVLAKYAWAVGSVEGTAAWADDPRVQQAALLIRLRNWLTHARPETHVVFSEIPEMPVTVRPLEEELGRHIQPNPKWGNVRPDMNAYLAHPCAAWALRVSLSYADAFWETLGVPAPYEPVRPPESPSTG